MAGTKKEEGKEYSSNWGGKRKNQTGRPSSTNSTSQKKCNFSIRVSQEELDRIRSIAKEKGKTITQLVIESIFNS